MVQYRTAGLYKTQENSMKDTITYKVGFQSLQYF